MVEKSDLSPSQSDWWTRMYEPMRQIGSRIADIFTPSSEASVTKDFYEIDIELPGVSEKDISVEAHDGKLTISGEKKFEREEKERNYYFSERAYGSFRRTFRLPADADEDNILATHKDGLLTIKIAKQSSKSAEPRRIDVKRA